MNDYSFELTKKPPHDTEEFREATREELRVLALLLSGSLSGCAEELAELAAVSVSRLRSSLALWEEAGVIRARDTENRVTLEFEERLEYGVVEESGVSVARHIRDEALAGLFTELASLMKKTELTPAEVKRVTLLSKQYSLSGEYIMALAAHMCEEGSLSIGKLVGRAVKLAEGGTDTVEALEIYISDKKRAGVEFSEIKRLLGIYNRNPSPSELRYFKRWQSELSYSVKIIGEAYDIAVMNTGKISLKYMDTLLTDWHDNNCKTADECKQRYEKRAEELAEKYKSPSAKIAKMSVKKEKPRYGDFDPEEALRSAVARGFADEDK